MYLTEDEAKTKWCPQMRAQLVDPQNVTDGQPLQFGRAATWCIGSACMAWRYGRKPNPNYRENNMWPDSRSPHERYSEIEDKEHGFCGLAGRP